MSDAEATLRKHGLGKYIKKLRTEPPFEGETVLILDVKDNGTSTASPTEVRVPRSTTTPTIW